MNNKVKRYNKSFIGLMEQCDDGVWVQSTDFDTLKQQQETASRNAERYENLSIELEENLSKYQQMWLEKHNSMCFWKLIATIALMLLTILSTSLLIVKLKTLGVI